MIVLIRGYGGVPGERWLLMIKRIAGLPGDSIPVEHALGMDTAPTISLNQLYVLSDGEEGIDSRVWGPIPFSAVFGVVLLKLTRQR
jgi:type IV secretory pathway protease TraF